MCESAPLYRYFVGGPLDMIILTAQSRRSIAAYKAEFGTYPLCPSVDPFVGFRRPVYVTAGMLILAAGLPALRMHSDVAEESGRRVRA
jgi:hypothetical protein